MTLIGNNFLTVWVVTRGSVSDHRGSLTDLYIHIYRNAEAFPILLKGFTSKFYNYNYYLLSKRILNNKSFITTLISRTKGQRRLLMNDSERGYKFLKSFILSKQNELQEFATRSRLNGLIVLEVGSKGRENLFSFEELCDTIPRHVGSRSSVLKILNECVERGFFVKTQKGDDKRFRQYELHDDYKQGFIDELERAGYERKDK